MYLFKRFIKMHCRHWTWTSCLAVNGWYYWSTDGLDGSTTRGTEEPKQLPVRIDTDSANSINYGSVPKIDKQEILGNGITVLLSFNILTEACCLLVAITAFGLEATTPIPVQPLRTPTSKKSCG